MGAWGAGIFENDDALDFVGELAADTCAAKLAELFESVAAAGMQGESIELPEACQVLAGVGLIAAARGHSPRDLPDDAESLVQSLQHPSRELVEKGTSALSYVLMSSELVDLWAETDDPSEWNKVATGLIAGLDAPARAKQIPKKRRNEMSAAVCSFCGELIPTMDLVSLDLRRPWSQPGVSRGIYAHESCLNAKLHPKYLVQWWTPDVEV